jgi:hypothetical protein
LITQFAYDKLGQLKSKLWPWGRVQPGASPTVSEGFVYASKKAIKEAFQCNLLIIQAQGQTSVNSSGGPTMTQRIPMRCVCPGGFQNTGGSLTCNGVNYDFSATLKL